MVRYNEFGFKSEEEYLNVFFSTLLSSHKNYAYFVDWKRVKVNVLKHTTEIGILNSLINVPKNERKAKILEIIRKYPEVVPLIPVLIAVRENSVEIYNALTNETKLFSFDKSSENAEDMAEFCDKTGLLDAFDEINDLHTYLLGLEVGMDTNARKNRSGDLFEDIVGQKLKETLNDMDVVIKPQCVINSVRKKKFDFVVFKEDTPIILLECNFYGGGGSKPIETASSYVDLQEKARAQNLTFVWVTDGNGWTKMGKKIKSVSPEIDYLFNLHLLEANIKKIVGRQK